MPRIFFSLRTRIILIVAFGFCVFILAMVYQAVRERNARLATAENELATRARLISVAAHNTIESDEVFLTSLLQSPDLHGLVDAVTCQRMLARTVAQLPQISNALLALPDGKVVCSALPQEQHPSLTDRPYFPLAMASSDVAIGEAFDDHATGKEVLPVYKVLRDKAGAVQGIVSFTLKLSWLDGALAQSEFREGSRVGLIDAQGHVLARFPDPHHWVGRNASDTSFFKNARAHGSEGIVTNIGFDGVPRVYGLAHFSSVSGPITLWVGYAADTVTAEPDLHFRNVLIGAFVVVLLAFTVIWLGVETLVLRPVSVLSSIARRLGSGDLRARSGIATVHNEMGALARAFDDMAEALESKNREITLATRALKVLSAWSSVLEKPSEEQALAEGMCKAIVDAGGYQMAWVGFAEDNPDKTVRPVAFAGDAEEYFETLQVTWADTEHGQGPAARAIREGGPIVVNDIQASPAGEPWREHLKRFGYASVMAVPLKADDRIVGALAIGAAESAAFAQDEALLLGEVASDLASAIFALRARVEHERLTASLRSTEERFAAAAEASPDAHFVFESVRDGAGDVVDFKITALNGRAAQQIGMARDDAIGKTYLELLPRYKTVSLFDEYAKVATTGKRLEEEFAYEVPKKGTRWFRQQVVRVGDGIAISLRDVTAWKTAGDKIRDAEERLRLALEAAHMGAWSADVGSDTYTLSENAGPIFGLPKGAGPRSTAALVEAVHPDDREALASGIRGSRETAQAARREFRVVWPDGSVHWVESHGSVICDEAGKPVRTVGVLTDITQRKLDVLALQRANRALKTLSAGNEALVHATSESELLDKVCHAIVEKGGYRMAGVGYPQNDPEKTLPAMAWAGVEEGYLKSAELTWADTGQGQRPLARAIRSGKAEIARNVGDDPAFAFVKDAVAKANYASNLGLPLLDGDKVIGGLSIYAAEADAFDDAEIELLQELANDLAYGIVTLRTREERDRIAHAHQHHAEILRKSLEDSITAIAATVEMRDPYTSGHQTRVAGLAVALAREMGLPEDRIHGLHLAGIVHDLGKISIPAEILSKPGRLSALEYELMKGHPQSGYDILKDIRFPWPIAEIVRQHHERLDGSGYPLGIKGDEILLESRIMAVADVVEAMASHRPYRASLGIEPALKEIERGRETAYDPAVVDACLKLFREEGFTIPS